MDEITIRVYNNYRITSNKPQPAKETALGKTYVMRRLVKGDDDIIPLEVARETKEFVPGDNPNPAPRMSRDYCGKCRIHFGCSERRDKSGQNHEFCS